MKDILKFPFALIICLISGIGFFTLINLGKYAVSHYEKFYAFGIGLLLHLLIARIRRNSTNLEFIRTFTHEFTHMLFSWLFFNRVSNFNVSAIGEGHVKYYGRSNFIISLSPYCIPIYTLFIILLTPVLKTSQIINGVIGVTYMFHLATFVNQCRSYQTDLRKHGLFFSYSVIVFVNIYICGVIMLFFKTRSLDAFWKFGNMLLASIDKLI